MGAQQRGPRRINEGDDGNYNAKKIEVKGANGNADEESMTMQRRQHTTHKVGTPVKFSGSISVKTSIPPKHVTQCPVPVPNQVNQKRKPSQTSPEASRHKRPRVSNSSQPISSISNITEASIPIARVIHETYDQAIRSIIDTCERQADTAGEKLANEEERHIFTKAELSHARSDLGDLTRRLQQNESFARNREVTLQSLLKKITEMTTELNSMRAAQREHTTVSESKLNQLDDSMQEITQKKQEVNALRAANVRLKVQVKELTQKTRNSEDYNHSVKGLAEQVQVSMTQCRCLTQVLDIVKTDLEAIRLESKKVAGANAKVMTGHQELVKQVEGFYGWCPHASDLAREEGMTKLRQNNKEQRVLIKAENDTHVGAYNMLKTLQSELSKCGAAETQESARAHVTEPNLTPKHTIDGERDPRRPRPESDSLTPDVHHESVAQAAQLTRSVTDNAVVQSRPVPTGPRSSLPIINDRRQVADSCRPGMQKPSKERLHKVRDGNHCFGYHVHGSCTIPSCTYVHGKLLEGKNLDALRYSERDSLRSLRRC